MKISKNFDEIRENVSIGKLLWNLNKKILILNICWNFEKNLNRVWENFI